MLASGHPPQDNIVAMGEVQPYRPFSLVHREKNKKNQVKVAVREAAPGRGSCELPIPAAHMKTVDEAINSYAAWPKELVIFIDSQVLI